MSKKVLIVEDEIFVALEIEQIVEDAGFDVGAIAADRAAALAGAASCDIALVDLNLRDGPTGPQIGEASVAALGVIMKPFRAQSIAAALQLAAAEQPELAAAEIAGFTPFPPPGSWNAMESRG